MLYTVPFIETSHLKENNIETMITLGLSVGIPVQGCHPKIIGRASPPVGYRKIPSPRYILHIQIALAQYGKFPNIHNRFSYVSALSHLAE